MQNEKQAPTERIEEKTITKKVKPDDNAELEHHIYATMPNLAFSRHIDIDMQWGIQSRE